MDYNDEHEEDVSRYQESDELWFSLEYWEDDVNNWVWFADFLNFEDAIEGAYSLREDGYDYIHITDNVNNEVWVSGGNL